MTFPYKKILCPVNFDETSAHAAEEAAALAVQGGGALVLLHVVHINPLVSMAAAEGPSGGEVYNAQVDLARNQVVQMAARLTSALKPEIVVEIGDPAEVILATERKLQADLVVMATHGRTGLARIVLGSVTDKIVRGSTAPVLTIRPGPRN